MALPVLDGNQSATFLSSVVTGGEHIVAHSVVCFGSTAISNITNAVSGSVVSVSNFPASQSTTFGAITGSVSVLNFPSTQTISGTVTANVGGVASGVTIPVRLFAEAEGGPSNQDTLVVCDSVGQLLINAKAGGASVLGYDGNAFVSVKQVAGSSVTIGSLPAISGTVTANANLFTTVTVQTITGGQNGSGILFLDNVGLYDVTFEAPGEYTIQSGFISGGFVATGVTLPLTNAFGTPITGNLHYGSLFRRQVPYSNLNTAFRITAVTTGMTPSSFTATVRAISDPYYGLDRPISGTVTVGNSVTIIIYSPKSKSI